MTGSQPPRIGRRLAGILSYLRNPAASARCARAKNEAELALRAARARMDLMRGKLRGSRLELERYQREVAQCAARLDAYRESPLLAAWKRYAVECWGANRSERDPSSRAASVGPPLSPPAFPLPGPRPSPPSIPYGSLPTAPEGAPDPDLRRRDPQHWARWEEDWKLVVEEVAAIERKREELETLRRSVLGDLRPDQDAIRRFRDRVVNRFRRAWERAQDFESSWTRAFLEATDDSGAEAQEPRSEAPSVLAEQLGEDDSLTRYLRHVLGVPADGDEATADDPYGDRRALDLGARGSTDHRTAYEEALRAQSDLLGPLIRPDGPIDRLDPVSSDDDDPSSGLL